MIPTRQLDTASPKRLGLRVNSQAVHYGVFPNPKQRSPQMISRQWRGLAKPEFAHDYVEHLKTETFPAIRKLPGFLDAAILRRSVPEGVEFLIITLWASVESIRAFAGSDVETAVVPQRVVDMMVDYDHVVRHYEVIE